MNSPYACPECMGSVEATDSLCATCSAVRPRGGWPLEPRIGRVVLGRYRLQQRIGQGASSEVFLAVDEQLPASVEGAKVVVKVLSGLASEQERKRFLAEVRAIRELRNPRIVKVYDAGLDQSTPCIVMEYLDGETLRSRMKRSPGLRDSEALAIACEIAAGLSEAHHKGIVHRDLKPENVMLIGTEVKVLDFGAATFTDGTGTQGGIGTPRYMAPEQMLPASERRENLDGRVDIYALGIVLYELLAHRLPFESDSLETLLRAKLVDKPLSIQRFRPDLSEDLAQAVMSMLEREPSRRPATMDAVSLSLSAASLIRTRSIPAFPVAIGIASLTLGLAAWSLRSKPSSWGAHVRTRSYSHFVEETSASVSVTAAPALAPTAEVRPLNTRGVSSAPSAAPSVSTLGGEASLPYASTSPKVAATSTSSGRSGTLRADEF